jgi:hypothetical protein
MKRVDESSSQPQVTNLTPEQKESSDDSWGFTDYAVSVGTGLGRVGSYVFGGIWSGGKSLYNYAFSNPQTDESSGRVARTLKKRSRQIPPSPALERMMGEVPDLTGELQDEASTYLKKLSRTGVVPDTMVMTETGEEILFQATEFMTLGEADMEAFRTHADRRLERFGAMKKVGSSEEEKEDILFSRQAYDDLERMDVFIQVGDGEAKNIRCENSPEAKRSAVEEFVSFCGDKKTAGHLSHFISQTVPNAIKTFFQSQKGLVKGRDATDQPILLGGGDPVITVVKKETGAFVVRYKDKAPVQAISDGRKTLMLDKESSQEEFTMEITIGSEELKKGTYKITGGPQWSYDLKLRNDMI